MNGDLEVGNQTKKTNAFPSVQGQSEVSQTLDKQLFQGQSEVSQILDKQLFQNSGEMNMSDIMNAKTLVTSYREAANFLYRAASELEQLIPTDHRVF